MGDISKHFNRSEFKCKCGKCSHDVVDVKLIEVLEVIRGAFSAPVTVTSGNRCDKYNAEIGGVNGSQHTLGKAADIQVKGVSPEAVASFLKWRLPGKLGIGVYSNFVHIDVRGVYTTWYG